MPHTGDAFSVAGRAEPGRARRVLVVAYYFPPLGGIGSIRLASFARDLPEAGWAATVLAPTGTPHQTDMSLDTAGVEVIRARSLELSALAHALRPAPAATELCVPTAPPASSARGLRAFLHNQLYHPDPQIGWYPLAVRAGLRALRRSRFDLIYSSSNPLTAHLIARTLARRSGVPWVAEFRDSLADRVPAAQPGRERIARLEAALAAEAAQVVAPSPSWAALWSRRWGRPVAVVPNGHDLDVAPVAPEQPPVLAYLGTYCAHEQSLAPLWPALRRLLDEPPAPAVRVRFIGDLPPAVLEQMTAAGVEGTLEATGFVAHDEAIRQMAGASILLASGSEASNDDVAAGVIPAKLFEYLASGRPIVYVGDARHDAARLLREHPGCFVVARDDTDGALAALRAALAEPYHGRDVQSISRRARARTLAAVFQDALQPRLDSNAA
jgi:glycosyltransferase involved in cell wall biosynthesis